MTIPFFVREKEPENKKNEASPFGASFFCAINSILARLTGGQEIILHAHPIQRQDCFYWYASSFGYLIWTFSFKTTVVAACEVALLVLVSGDLLCLVLFELCISELLPTLPSQNKKMLCRIAC